VTQLEPIGDRSKLRGRAFGRTVLTVGGIACLVTAAWLSHVIAGLVVLGLALIYLECLTGNE
jgi:hypothetical protein